MWTFVQLPSEQLMIRFRLEFAAYVRPWVHRQGTKGLGMFSKDMSLLNISSLWWINSENMRPKDTEVTAPSSQLRLHTLAYRLTDFG